MSIADETSPLLVESIAIETSLLLGTAMFVFSIPIPQVENLQRSRSKCGPRLSPTISSGKITVLQRQDCSFISETEKSEEERTGGEKGKQQSPVSQPSSSSPEAGAPNSPSLYVFNKHLNSVKGLNPHKPPRAAVPKLKREISIFLAASPNNVNEIGYENLIAPHLSSPLLSKPSGDLQ
ncbi:hypothetical protein NC652_039604 [Populus alba x Populus x berolinensis]|nr:hypothetical protein NC652_039604 [Populus alba x Populus x berolinensis]